MLVALGVIWTTKLMAVFLGLIPVAIGVGFIRLGAPLIALLNKLYARLPGRFQYPRWWHRLVGGLFVAIGLLIAIPGAILAGR